MAKHAQLREAAAQHPTPLRAAVETGSAQATEHEDGHAGPGVAVPTVLARPDRAVGTWPVSPATAGRPTRLKVARTSRQPVGCRVGSAAFSFGSQVKENCPVVPCIWNWVDKLLDP